MTESGLAIVAALVFAWGALSARLERLDPTAPIVFVIAGPAVTVISITVLLSVIAHGATAEPLARRYAARPGRAGTGPAHAERAELPVRKLRAHAVQEIGSRLTPRWKFDRK